MTKQDKIIFEIAQKVKNIGGRTYYVGGCVRDKLMQIECLDKDIEIHGIDIEQLRDILHSFTDNLIENSHFGVFNLPDYTIDVALPRSECLSGKTHKDFEINILPYMDTIQATVRRDFTINAMMEDVLTGELIDHYGGLSDLENGIIRHIDDERFIEDPLRVLRAAQFSARFQFKVDEKTMTLCRKMSIESLPRERVFDELKKALLKSDKPSLFFEIMREADRLDEFFKELKDLIGIEQNEKHHAEGDVWVHTMMVLDECAKRRGSVKNPLGFMLSAVCHDMGKAICTEVVNGEIHSYNHEIEGLPIAESFINRLTTDKKTKEYVLNMVEFHMRPNTLAAMGSAIKKTNKMFDQAVEPLDLIHLAIADSLGKVAHREYYETEPFLMERLELFEEQMKKPYVTGADLIDAGFEPGEKLGKMLEYAHKLRLAGCEKESALRQTISFGKKLK